MGYELDKLLNRYGVSAPTIPYSGAATAEQKPALDAYKTAYQQRIRDTPSYVGAVGMPQRAPVAPPPSNPALSGGTAQFTPGAQQIFNPQSPQQQQMQGAARTPENKQIIRDFFSQNPNLTQEQIRAKQQEFGVTNPDIYAATGNYWGNTLRPPTFAPAVLPGDQGPPKPVGAAPVVGPAQPMPADNDPDAPWSRKKWDVQLGYAEGGLVDEEDQYGRGLDLSRVSPQQLAMLQKQDSGALQRGIGRFAESQQPRTPEPPRVNPMLELLEKYQAPSNNYAGELKAARERSSADSQAFQDMIKQAAEAQSDSGPSKSEMYFRLAAALGSPTKTGSFGETLGRAASTLGDYQGEVRQAQRAGAANKLQLALQGQQARMAASKDDLNTTRQLAAEEMKEQRAGQAKVMEAYFKSGQPQSEAGKIAIDAGFQAGTPEYNNYVKSYIKDKMDSGNLFKEAQLAIAQSGKELAAQRLGMEQQKFEAAKAEKAKLTAPEMKLKTETEDTLAQITQAMEDTKTIFKLIPNTYTNSLADKAAYTILSKAGSEDPKVVNTSTMQNLGQKASLSQLKSTFPGAVSNDERKALDAVQGLEATDHKTRAAIVKAAYKAQKTIAEKLKKRLEEINAGQYRSTIPSTEPEGLE